MVINTDNSDYLNGLTVSLTQLLNSILAERGIPLFRKASSVLLSSPSPTSTDFHLCFLRKSFLDAEKGSFTCTSEDGDFLVFRNPVKIKASFALVSPAVSVTQALRAQDRLMSYFFDHRTVEPFLPSVFLKYPMLHEKLISQKAELRMNESIKEFEGFYFGFDYTALYHSGNPLREEQRARTRVLDFANKQT